MRNLYGYNNELWEEIMRFTYTGSPQKFTLSPGTYLFQCHGASGGFVAENLPQYGGLTMGIIDLAETTDMYAYVGGNGGNPTTSTPGHGGWNGGAAGGYGYNTNYLCGAGGGGGTDIRMKRSEDFDPGHHDDDDYVPQLPEGYEQVEYVATTGTQYFDTGYIAKTNTIFIVEAAQADVSNDMAFLGSQYDNGYGDGWIVWLSRNGRDYQYIESVYANRNFSWDNITQTGVAMNQKALYQIDRWGIRVNHNQLRWEDYLTGRPQTNSSIILFGMKRGGSVDSRVWIGKLYYCRIYETDPTMVPKLVREFVPCVHNGVAGIYETVTDTFIAPSYLYGSDPLSTGAVGSYNIKKDDLKYRYHRYTVPDEYQLVDYIESNGKQYINTKYMMKQSDFVLLEATLKTGEADYEEIFGIRQYVLHSVQNEYMALSRWGDRAFYPSFSKSSNTEYTMDYIPQRGDDTAGTRHIGLYMYKKYGMFTDATGDITLQSQFSGNITTIAPGPLFIFDINCCDAQHPEQPGYIAFAGSYDVRPCHMFLHKFYVYDSNGDLVHAYLPCYRKSDNVAGLVDVIDGSFYTNQYENGEDFVVGNDVNDPPKIVYINRAQVDEFADASFNTRIMVAGGGGGGTMSSDISLTDPDIPNSPHCARGGGIVGGPVVTYPGYINNGLCATQTSGYKFGEGQTPSSRPQSSYSWGCEGHSGGGGGWYGGYTGETYTGNYNACNGGGGSGYVLTDDSYKPPEYNVDRSIRFRNWYMKGGAAVEPCVIISKLTNDILAEDTITYYPVGATCKTTIPPGTYIFKCWGAWGGARYVYNTTSTRPGYAEGKFVSTSGNNLYINVGGSSISDSLVSSEIVRSFAPDLCFNGGGQPLDIGKKMTGHGGGGASDIRVDSNSLYSRIIVAGGTGGGNQEGVRPGSGGGTSGAFGDGNRGICPGPGTQTNSPISVMTPVVNGGFGYGGNCARYDAGRTGGSGGGGWYGGSGSVPVDPYTTNRAGCGGSGFVYTSESTVPPDYLLDETYYLTDTTLTTGGSNLPYGFSKVEIYCVQAYQQKFICYDSEGYKYYNSRTNRWILIPDQEITVETFNTYGIATVETDDGLEDEFDIVMYDPNDVITHADLNVRPVAQKVYHTAVSTMPIKRTFFNLDYDRTEFSVDLNVVRHQAGQDTEIRTTISIDKLVDTNDDCKIYDAQYISK